MWTVENRARYDRSKLRYPGDLTDEEWALAKGESKHPPSTAVLTAADWRGVQAA